MSSHVEYKDQETYLYENNQEKLYEAHSHGTKEIWRVFLLLTAITIVDIILYFIMDATMFRNVVFIALGLVKAVLIVGYFMHLKHERVNLILSIVVPMVFIIFFIGSMLHEGNALSIFNK